MRTSIHLLSLPSAAVLVTAALAMGVSPCEPRVPIGTTECEYEGDTYANGESFSKGYCTLCTCSQGEVTCVAHADWVPNEPFPSRDGCNTCTCSEDGAIACTERACAHTCEFEGVRYASGETRDVLTGSRSCGAFCKCEEDGTWMCASPDECMPCELEGRRYASGEQRVTGTPGCEGFCECQDDGGWMCASPGCLPPCAPTGCSGQICADEEVYTTCEVRPEYACYATATCERQGDGECGWVMPPAFAQCMSEAGIGCCEAIPTCNAGDVEDPSCKDSADARCYSKSMCCTSIFCRRA